MSRRRNVFAQSRHAVSGRQQWCAGQPFLAGIESLIDEIFLNPNVSRKHLSDEARRSSPVCRQ
jgi:hypothetical protein